MAQQVIIPCSYFLQSKQVDAKLIFHTEGLFDLHLPRFGVISFELSDIAKHSYDAKMKLLNIQLMMKMENRNLDDVLYEKLEKRTKSHIEKNAKERIRSIFQIIATDQIQLQVSIEGNWSVYQTKFTNMVGMFTKMERPILYSIAPFFFDKRDASSSLNGYLYQVDLALSYWIDTILDEKEKDRCVMLEFGEDVAVMPTSFVKDIEDFADQKYQHKTFKEEIVIVFDQAKLYKKPISFMSDCICDIFFNYFIALNRAGSSAKVVYRFTASTTITDLNDWMTMGEKARQLLKDLIKLNDDKRQKNPNKSRYKRECDDWEKFKSFTETDEAVSILNQITFVQNKTPEVLSLEIENKLEKCSTYPKPRILSNFLYGTIKSRLLAKRDAKFSDKMFNSENLKMHIEELINSNTSSVESERGEILYEDTDVYKIIKDLSIQNEELKLENERLRLLLEEKP